MLKKERKREKRDKIGFINRWLIASARGNIKIDGKKEEREEYTFACAREERKKRKIYFTLG